MNNDFYDNSLIFIKYLLTIVVIVNHCITHFSLNSPQILFATVPTFFCISGYTVYHSISFKGRNKDFLFRRIKKIYPELWIVVLIGILVIVVQYPNVLMNVKTYLFILTQSTFLQFWTPESLSFYGCGVPNGALWTICVIIQFYILLYFLYPYIKKLTAKQDIIILLLLIVINPS